MSIYLPTLPTPGQNYSRDDESAFRAMIARTLGVIVAGITGITGDQTYYSVKDYRALGDGTTSDDAAFAAADTDAVAGAGVILVPPGTYLITGNLTITSPLLFAGGVIKIANTKTFTANGAITALAGDWADVSLGGTVVRPQDAYQPNGLKVNEDLSVGGAVIMAATKKFYPDGGGDTYIQESSANVVQAYAGGNLMLTYNATQMGFFGHALASRPSAYTPTNVTTDRAYDADATTTAELADVLGTVIADLQALGVFQ